MKDEHKDEQSFIDELDIKPEVIRMGLFDCQVCVPKSYSDEQAIAIAEEGFPCGTQAGWQVRKQEHKLLGDDDERVQCEYRPDYVHIMLDA